MLDVYSTIGTTLGSVFARRACCLLLLKKSKDGTLTGCVLVSLFPKCLADFTFVIVHTHPLFVGGTG